MSLSPTANATTCNALYKILYPNPSDLINESMVTKNCKFYQLLKKKTDFAEKYYQLPVIYTKTQGRSKTFSTSYDNRSDMKNAEFDIPRIQDYSHVSIAGEQAESGKKAVILDIMKTRVDACRDALLQSVCAGLYNNGGGAIGKLGAAPSTVAGNDQLTLASPEDIINFEADQTIVFATTDGTSGAIVAGERQIIRVLDRALGIFEISGTVPGGVTTGHYVFTSGDFGKAMFGLPAWLPSAAYRATAAFANTFCGQNRTIDADRLAGYILNNGSSIEEKIKNMMTMLFRAGARPDTVICSPENFLALDLGLSSRVTYPFNAGKGGKEAEFGFDGIKINGGGGQCMVYADPFCPPDKIYVLQMDTWVLLSLGQPVEWIKRDGLEFREDVSTDSITGKMRSYINLGCYAPGYNGVIDLAA